MNLNKLTGQVEAILQSVPESRNSDIVLTIEVWRKFYPKLIQNNDGLLWEKVPPLQFVFLKDLFELPREDNIKRIRAQFQNDKLLYFPTDFAIAKQRRINEEVWRKTMGQGDVLGRLKPLLEDKPIFIS